ncbi:hypothetical protein AAY473_037769 [Plecturocebus cupreus]
MDLSLSVSSAGIFQLLSSESSSFRNDEQEPRSALQPMFREGKDGRHQREEYPQVELLLLLLEKGSCSITQAGVQWDNHSSLEP